MTGSPATPAATTSQIHGCVNTKDHRILQDVFTQSVPTCPAGTFAVKWNTRGPAGPQGPSGIVSSAVTNLVSSPETIATGGPFVTNSTALNTLDLAAGTYLITFNAQAEAIPSGDQATAAGVSPQFFLYNQVKNSGFTGDLCNIGTGQLAAGTAHDAYFSGTCQITLQAATTLHPYAFGYDADQGASQYTLENATITATQLNTGN